MVILRVEIPAIPEKWKVNLGFMTEESDYPENPNGIVEHRGRSQSKLVFNATQKLQNLMSKSKSLCLVAKKVRRYGILQPMLAVRPERNKKLL